MVGWGAAEMETKGGLESAGPDESWMGDIGERR
jgi:hypothetical protein